MTERGMDLIGLNTEHNPRGIFVGNKDPRCRMIIQGVGCFLTIDAKTRLSNLLLTIRFIAHLHRCFDLCKTKTRRNRYNRGIRTIRESIKSIVSYSFIISTTICMAEDSPG